MRNVALSLFLLFGAGCAQDALDAVLKKLQSPDETERGTAVWELGDFQDRRAPKAVIAALRDPSSNVRVSAAMVLDHALWQDPEITVALCRATKDPEEQVRTWAAHALGSIGNPAALPDLNVAARDPEEGVRYAATQAIRAIQSNLQAREGRYHPPTSLPPELKPDDRETYLKAHEEYWTFTISRVTDEEMAAPKLSIASGTICERPELETKGGYHGQGDAHAFLTALHKRCIQEPAALGEFKILRDAALKRYPPPKEEREQ